MDITSNRIYHIYSDGNNKEPFFFERDNYLHFIKQSKKFVSPYAEVLAYCLMPNQFHFLLYTNEQSKTPIRVGGVQITNLANGFRQLQSSYAKAVNVEEQRVGATFKQEVKSRLVDVEDSGYPVKAFHYIHQSPCRAGLVEKIDEWEFSSYKDFIKRKQDSLCNAKLAIDLLSLDMPLFAKESEMDIEDVYLQHIL